jgi:hypothetical protein
MLMAGMWQELSDGRRSTRTCFTSAQTTTSINRWRREGCPIIQPRHEKAQCILTARARRRDLESTHRRLPVPQHLELLFEDRQSGTTFPPGSRAEAFVDPRPLSRWSRYQRVEDHVSSAWDAEYRSGRYEGESPVRFVDDILAAVAASDVSSAGLYIGCGNGRNYVPLVEGGLDLVGLDVSRVAIEQLAARMPDRRQSLILGDLASIPRGERYPVVVGIQVFQHGDRTEAHDNIRAAQHRVMDGGLFCLRVNAVGTDFEYNHRIEEQNADGGITIRYLEGPKSGLRIHFFSHQELGSLFAGWDSVLPLRIQETWRQPRSRGRWLQWEAIWRR